MICPRCEYGRRHLGRCPSSKRNAQQVLKAWRVQLGRSVQRLCQRRLGSAHSPGSQGSMWRESDAEVTLKGVEDGAIIKVFGSEIHGAVQECAIRRRETKPATECISMILTQNGAFINLSLGLEVGLRIQSQLYT